MEPQLITLNDDGVFSNSRLPVVLYKNAMDTKDLPTVFKQRFKQNNWYNSWEADIFTFHHYHSNTHEVMGVCRGTTTLQLGGGQGEQVTIATGDVLIIPAGVAHKNLREENAVTCIGAYPDGREYGINYGNKGERPETDRRIAAVPVPGYDPLFGKDAGVAGFWKKW